MKDNQPKQTEYDDNIYYGIDNQIQITKSTEDWAQKIQLKKQFQLNSQSCPKEDKVLYSHQSRKVKVFGKNIVVKGIFRLPEVVSLKNDSETKWTKLNPYMFPKNLFINREAKMARRYLCMNCPLDNCNYKLKKGR